MTMPFTRSFRRGFNALIVAWAFSVFFTPCTAEAQSAPDGVIVYSYFLDDPTSSIFISWVT